jgi:hypothetical protein
MLALKIISAVIVFSSVALRIAMDFFWKDKRTNRHRQIRNGFIITALLASILGGVVLWIEEAGKRSNQRIQAGEKLDFENMSFGGLAPDIFVELYTGPNFPTPPRVTFRPPFPGHVVIWIDNTNKFPIYDLRVNLVHYGSNEIASAVMREFNKSDVSIPIARVNEGTTYFMPGDIHPTSNNFSFSTKTRRGSAHQVTCFVLVSNRWEYARSLTDNTGDTSKVIGIAASPNFPRDAKGNPIAF